MAENIDRAMLEAFRDDVFEILNDWELACLHARSKPPADTYRSLMRCLHNLKGNAGLMGFEELRDSAHRLEDRFLALEREGAIPADPSLLGVLFEIEKFFRHWLEALVDDPAFKPDSMNVLSKLEAWTKTARAEATVTPLTGAAAQADAPARASHAPATDTVRIPSPKLDALIQQVGELTLAQAIVSRGRQMDDLNSTATRDAILLCDKLVNNLRQTVLDMRMLPMAGLYGKLERAGMELSIKLRKPLHFTTEGQDVSVDKAVLNKIFDPLLHLVRNAIDHGLETQEERQATGKPPAGTVHVSAAIVPSGVCIRLRDDGRGLNHQKIWHKAVERGLVSDGEPMSADRALSLIFEPGFSTADSVTEISGRGVGLDVVKKEVVNLGGQLDLKSTPGQGTEFIITLPANISLIEVFVIECEGQSYCVPTQEVEEILNAGELAFQSSTQFDQMIELRGRVIPVKPLSAFMGGTANAADVYGCVIVVSDGGQRLGLAVHTVTQQQQIFVHGLKGYLSTLAHVSGTTILSTGEPSLILNVKEIASSYFTKFSRRSPLGEHAV
jgi:two-component system chemotaxis sensor kinase CheA